MAILGYIGNCQERFDRGETVAILCAEGKFLYRLIVRKRGMAKSRIIYEQ